MKAVKQSLFRSYCILVVRQATAFLKCSDFFFFYGRTAKVIVILFVSQLERVFTSIKGKKLSFEKVEGNG